MNDERRHEHSSARLHRRITVVRADDAQRAAVVASMSVPRPGVVDLNVRPVLVRADEVTAQAAALAADRAGERRTALRRLEQELRSALVARDEASGARDGLIARLQRLDDDRRWCEELAERADDMAHAVAQAAAAADVRKAEHRDAVERLERVLEQRGAAAAAIEDADQELAELEGVQLDETGVRRELEAANRAARDAGEALAAAQSRLAQLEAQRAEAVAASEAAVAARGRAGTALEAPSVDDTRVRDALRALESEATFGTRGASGTGPALAEQIRVAEAALAHARAEAGPSASPAEVAAAQAELEAAEQGLRDLDAASESESLTPAARVEIDAAHEAVLEAEDRAARGARRAAARRRLEQLRVAEQEVLARHGYDSYLDVVLSGGRPGGGGVRLAAEQRIQTARDHLVQVRAAAAGSDEVQALVQQLSDLARQGAELLGVDPGDRLGELLDSHPAVSPALVADLAAALDDVGVHPVATPITEAAASWLAEQAEIQSARRQGRDQLQHLDAEIGRCTEALEQLAAEIDDTSRACERAGRDLDVARRRVSALEAELTARAGEDARRLQRMAAAEQLRSQVEALAATLARAEAEARAALDALSASLQAAELAWDRAEAEQGDASRRLLRIAQEHLEGRPLDLGPDPIASAATLAAELAGPVERLQRSLAAAEAAVARATADADAVAAEVAELRAGQTGPTDADRLDAVLRAVTREAPGSVIVLDDEALATASYQDDLFDRLVAATEDRAVVIVTSDPAVLGWAIALPAEHGLLITATSLDLDADLDGGSRAAVRLPDPHHAHHDAHATGQPGRHS